jgi:hypothetical protein
MRLPTRTESPVLFAFLPRTSKPPRRHIPPASLQRDVQPTDQTKAGVCPPKSTRYATGWGGTT